MTTATETMSVPAAARSREHEDYLTGAAISTAILDATGVSSENDVIVFPWRDGGQVTRQTRVWPDPPSMNGHVPKSAKYRWEAGRPLHLWAIRPVTGETKTVLIAEGTKQSLSAASWAPPEYAVYGMAGCDGWTNTDLSRFAGYRVIIMLDADAGSNHEVYEAGAALAAKLELLGAEPRFVTSPGRAKDGLDDFLAGIAAGQRSTVLVNLLAKADGKDAGKPAPRKPAKKPGKPDSGDRPAVQVNRDRFAVICDITQVMLDRYSGRELFNFGGAVTELNGIATNPLDRDTFARWLAQAVATHKMTDKGYEPCWPDPQTMGAILAGSSSFVPLDRVSLVPFIRPDGTACTMPGYDPMSRTWLVPGPGRDEAGNPDGSWTGIPDEPAREQAAAAADRMLGPDWLGDMPWRDEASRANALALVLTPFIRGLVSLVPLAVISGLQPGVGKGLLADCIALMLTGEATPPLAWLPDEDDENRKQILSAFRDGSQLIWFDEAHQIESHALSRAITSLTYADRILGVSKIARYPNRVTWMSTGNQVRVSADMSRRAYFIELYPDKPNPQDRPASDFRHPELREWTMAARPGLVTDALTIIRSWFAAGSPPHDRGMSMGSFERWDAMMSGILDWAGVPGFLGNLEARRSERDTSGGYWADHLTWLAETFPGRTFTLLDIKGAATAAGGAWDAPPGFTEPDAKGWTQRLGTTYSHHADRYYGQHRLVKIGTTTGTKGTWKVEALPLHLLHPEIETLPDRGGNRLDEVADEVLRGNALDEVDELDEALPSRVRPQAPPRDFPQARTRVITHTREGENTSSSSSTSSTTGLVLGFDLETADATALFTTPRGPGYVRLAGITGPGGSAIVEPHSLGTMLTAAEIVFGHNILGFDGLALAWHLGLDWDGFCDRARDTELIARQYWPPRSRESGTSADKLGLDAVAALAGLPGKTGDLKRLARKHGGYGQIPVDDPEYRAYLDGDLAATAGVHAALGHLYDADPYLPREHALARIAGHMRLNGILVDQELLRERREAGEARKRAALQSLHDGWGLPLSRTVMRGRGSARHETEQVFDSPLATDEGRAWLAAQWQRYQVPAPPRTAKTGKLALGAAELSAIADDPACDPGLRAMIALMNIVTTTRTVYQTATDWLCPDGRVHPAISFRQASGRWSVTEPGMTVFGKRGGRHVERDIFVASPGTVLMSFDLEQIDMRVIAGHCQDPAYMALFAPGRDAHSEIAARVFGEMPRDARGRHPRRQDAKEYAHGWNYGLGAKRMIENGNPPDQVYAYVDGMRSSFPVLCGWREGIQEAARAGEILDNGWGRRMRAEPSRGYTVGPALMGQGGARDALGDCMLRLDRALYADLLLQVHDELVFEFPEDDWQDRAAAVREAMTTTWRGVPILVDQSGPGHSFGEISAK